MYVHNGGRGQLSIKGRHNKNAVIMRTGTASAVGARRHNGNEGCERRECRRRETS